MSDEDYTLGKLRNYLVCSPAQNSCRNGVVMEAAALAIEQRDAEIERLRAENERLRREISRKDAFTFVFSELEYPTPGARYTATLGDYDLDCPIGSGETPADAIREWLDLHEDKLPNQALAQKGGA